ncbi:MAG: pseudaminic acid synthase [Patescibacteria group bacterium]|jgi:pseudaminic acid synthase
MRLKIGNKTIGDGAPAFIVAELSANHGNKFEIAADTVRAMRDSGADAVKLQTYTADTITLNCDNDYFKIKQGTIWDGKNLHKLYEEASMPWEWQPKLKKIANDLGMECFSTPFDNTAVDFLEKMDVPAYKIASFEITDIPLIEYTASKGKPMILATGVAELSDIEDAIAACRRMGNNQIAVLKCTSSYPAPLREINLATIPDIGRRLKAIAGLSDHTIGSAIPIASCALGAKIIEKHFILDKKIGGPDASFSMEPEDFRKMVSSIREVEESLGKVNYELTEKASKSRDFCRSLFVAENIERGELFTTDNIRSVRPGFGLPPKHLNAILGKRAKKHLEKGTPLNWMHI